MSPESIRESTELVDVRGVTKRFGAVTALGGVSFGIRRGEVLGLIGPNGAGKTTLFECLAGELPADAGEVLWQGRPLAAGHRKETLFYLPDQITPWAGQPVGRVLSFFSRLFGADPSRLSALAGTLGLSRFLSENVGELSKGERRRVLLALGLSVPREILLFDEPFDGLDLRQAREVEGVLRRAAAQGRTLFLSIHQLTDAARVCDRLVLLSAGRVAGEGTLSELRNRAGLEAGGLEEVFLALT
ncbi:MAG TPA: ABC transporter ATP-binding protein [Thermoanaerobaculia bacterium]|nr:ABC transporter ATP-binding protein [Thermoanaerobaculia bacterium]